MHSMDGNDGKINEGTSILYFYLLMYRELPDGLVKLGKECFSCMKILSHDPRDSSFWDPPIEVRIRKITPPNP